MILKLGHDGLEAFLKITTVACACEQGTHVEREDDGVLKYFGCFTCNNFAGKALGDGGFAHTWVTDQQRVVLAAAAEDLDTTLNFGITTDERINIAVAGFFVQVYAVFL